jgi:hypothetical protein
MPKLRKPRRVEVPESQIAPMRALRLASHMVLQFIERPIGVSDENAPYHFDKLRELLDLARTREGAAEELELSAREGNSLGVTIALLHHLPEIGPGSFETAIVDMPGGASASRCVH